MNTVDEIVTTVEGLLAAGDGYDRADRVLAYLARLNALGENDEKRPRIKMRPGMVFFATVGKLLGSTVVIDVRIHGRRVGEVSLRADGLRVFSPVSPWKDEWCEKWSDEQIDWGDKRVLHFLRQREGSLPETEAEAKVQSELFMAMREGKGSKKLQELHNNQPVQMLGLPFQFPLPISASGPTPKVSKGLALGHADILARSDSGHHIKIFEIKKPGGAAAHALAQGVAYAAALGVLLQRNPAVMFKALGYSKLRTRLPRFSVWAFVNRMDVSAVLKSGRALQESNHHYGLHVMPYSMNSAGRLEIDSPVSVEKP